MPIWLPIVSKFDSTGVNQADSGLSKLGGAFKGIGIAAGVAFAAAGAAAIAFGASSLKAAAESEAISLGMENAAKNAGMFGSTAADIGKATKALDDHSTKLAELTGIDDELFNSMKTGWLATPSLAALGTEGINNLAKVAADVSAGTGKDIGSIGLAFQKVAGDSETALSKLTRQGIILSDSQKEVYESMVANGDEAEAQAYLIDELGKKYAGAAEAAANPFERLKVIFENLQETVGKAMLPAIEKLVPVIADFVGKLTASPAFQQFIEALATTFGQLTDALLPLMQPIMDLIMALLPPLMSIIQALVPVIVTLVQAFLPLIEAVLPIFVDLVNALLPIFTQLINDLIVPLIPVIVRLIEAFMPLITAILPIVGDLITALVPVIFALIDAFLPIIEAILPPLLDLFMAVSEPMTDMLINLLPGLVPVIKALGDSLLWLTENILVPLIDGLTAAVDWFNKLLGFDGKSVSVQTSGVTSNNDGSPNRDGNPSTPFARGGIVSGRIDNAIVGEAGPEAIIPLDRLESMMGTGGGGATVNITVNAGMGADGASIGEQIVTAIRKYERTSGKVFAAA